MEVFFTDMIIEKDIRKNVKQIPRLMFYRRPYS